MKWCDLAETRGAVNKWEIVMKKPGLKRHTFTQYPKDVNGISIDNQRREHIHSGS